MTKLETFRWRMWHVYLLIFITILLTGTFVRYGYRLQAAYSLDDRLYDYTNKKIIVNSEVDHLAKSFHINFENHFRNTLDSCPRNKFHSFCSK